MFGLCILEGSTLRMLYDILTSVSAPEPGGKVVMRVGDSEVAFSRPGLSDMPLCDVRISGSVL